MRRVALRTCSKPLARWTSEPDHAARVAGADLNQVAELVRKPDAAAAAWSGRGRTRPTRGRPCAPCRGHRKAGRRSRAIPARFRGRHRAEPPAVGCDHRPPGRCLGASWARAATPGARGDEAAHLRESPIEKWELPDCPPGPRVTVKKARRPAADVGGAIRECAVAGHDRDHRVLGLDQHLIAERSDVVGTDQRPTGPSPKARLSSDSWRLHSSNSAAERPAQTGSPIPLAPLSKPRFAARNSHQQGMMRAGLRPTLHVGEAHGGGVAAELP